MTVSETDVTGNFVNDDVGLQSPPLATGFKPRPSVIVPRILCPARSVFEGDVLMTPLIVAVVVWPEVPVTVM